MENEKTYTTAIFAGNESSETDRITVKKKEKYGPPELSVKHTHGDEDDYYKFRITDDSKRICKFSKSIRNSPDTPPHEVIQSVVKYGYDPQFYDIENVPLYIKLIIRTINEAGRKYTDGSTFEYVNIVGESFLHLHLLWDNLTPEEYADIESSILESYEPDSDEIESVIHGIAQEMVRESISRGYIDNWDEKDSLDAHKPEIDDSTVTVTRETIGDNGDEYIFASHFTTKSSKRYIFRAIDTDSCHFIWEENTDLPPLDVINSLSEFGVEVANLPSFYIDREVEGLNERDDIAKIENAIQKMLNGSDLPLTIAASLKQLEKKMDISTNIASLIENPDEPIEYNSMKSAMGIGDSIDTYSTESVEELLKEMAND